MSSTSETDRDERQLPRSPARTPVGHAKRAISQHKFQIYNYKKPTFCAHCGGLLVGVIKQGLKCKRCEVDVHEKCQEDLNKACIELIVGNHNFREKSYTKPTYCDFCTKLLVGVVNQGLKCTECGANVHEKCQEKIEASCEKLKSRLQKEKSPSTLAPDSPSQRFQRGRESRVSQRRANPNEKTPLTPQHHAAEVGNGRDYSQMFQTMPGSTAKDQFLANSAQTNGVKKKSAQTPANQLLHQQVGEVTSIMQKNYEKMEMRHEKLEDLENQSEKIVETASKFKKLAKDLEKKYWWKNKKLWIGVGAAILLLLIIVIIIIVLHFNSGTNKTSNVETTPANNAAG